ncbi:chemotaxis protein CheB [Thiohalobacter thiocyanaticus]|uniref:protein-glutamate O-methyltransferase n=1 Tax=Thiohalobacter thiocyanaticus TaxID=585455 RepID=A0A426QHX2_9GAMM|nr:chemotaxis protein CheB [Thiohalobacter thiocyanaticus]RRQ21343.1 PAS domain S-box protein [Thiohalobacter thiocyanaticus]
MVSLTAANSPATPAVTTRIVGIGASAGGLAPLEEFLGNIPPHSGMAYVVVQHLDPTHKALLSELLQRVTAMPVREAQQNMRIEPDCVYVIPPNTELSIVNATLHLASPAEPRGMRLPINVLFSSLAGTQGERAIAVVLSGMGSDGTLGLQAVKAVGGLTAVQQPDTAQFDAMPRSAIAAECADIIAPPAELPARILAYVAQVPDPGVPAGDDLEPTLEPEPLQRILDLLQKRTRHDFSLYKPSTLHRRVERRMAIHDITTLAQYADFLQDNTHEIDLLFKELLIGVTNFFRDPAVWEHLANVTLPELLARRTTERMLRGWVVGCSTGEEAYSLAMVFNEVIHQRREYRDVTLQIFATDLSPEAIDTARRGRYPASIEEAVSAERLARFFRAREGGGYEINTEIRDMVLFAQQDVILDPPFTKLDLIACRNLLIYYDATLQRRLIPLFHYSLREGGVLLLGSAETVGRFNNLFTPIQSSLRLYQRRDDAPSGGAEFMMKSFPPLSKVARENSVSTTDHTPSDNLQAAADQVLLQVYAPAAVVINSDGDILYISGRTGKYLEPAAGKANWNIHAMVREGLRVPISAALKKSTIESEPQHLHGLKVQLPGGGVQRVDVTVQALREPAALRGATMIVFRDIAPDPAGGGKRKGKTTVEASHEAELQQYRDEIQTLREEARASKEELQSANEELQSTNEELQSTNEELTTSKEEMQSMNEELQTINAELHSKLDDLALAQSDMSNLLNSTDIAILFLDQGLNVRRYTDRATKIVNIRESDVGRPLSDLTTNLQYPELHEDALETLRTLSFSEKQIQANDGRWFSVRIMPYRRLDNVIDGVVITFVDITETKRLEQELRRDLEE